MYEHHTQLARARQDCPGPQRGVFGGADQFRPITCLITMYKLYTRVIAQLLTVHVESRQILPEEQKALRKGRRGCLDALAVDGMAVIESKMSKRNLSVAWIDYRKAFDMIPQTDHEGHEDN